MQQRELLLALVGAAVRAVMDRQIRELIRREGSPNMYWALAGLPSAYSAIRTGVVFDQAVILRTIPALRDPENELATPEKWANVVHQLKQDIPQIGDIPLAPMAMLIALSPPAVKHVASTRDMTVQEVRQMPWPVIVGLYMRDTIQAHVQELEAVLQLPYPHAWPRIQEWAAQGEAPATPLTTSMELLSGLIPRIVRQAAERDRQTAALMAVEALRMHAAETGRLPAKLEDVVVVPIPNDPMTVKPFDYRLDDGTAILRQPAPFNEFGWVGVNYRIRLREE
jgi:hypothetical protein